MNDTPTLEAQTRALIRDGLTQDAVDVLLRHHGPSIYGYIRSITRDEMIADDAFQTFSIRLWRGLDRFCQPGKLKAWLYAIARNASYRTLQDPHRKRATPLDSQAQAQLERWSRTSTARWRQTQEKQKLWRLIEAFDPEDRELLTLRLGRDMTWREVVLVLTPDEGAPLAEDAIRRRAASLRKRFERLKEKLRDAYPPDETNP